MLKHKRTCLKVECLECGSGFNDDCQKKHEENLHCDKRVKVKHVGAPNNLFEFAAANVYTLEKRTDMQVDIYFK